MESLGSHLLVLLALVALVLDSRRLHGLVASKLRGGEVRSEPGLPAGADGDRVGLRLRQIQMRHHVDWQDGGIGWEGPEILPVDDADEVSPAEPNPRLPVLWKPYPAFLAAFEDCPPAETPALSSPESWSDVVVDGYTPVYGRRAG